MNNENSEKEVRKYELGFLLLEEDSPIVKNLLEKRNFSITEEGEIVKVNLAYPIKKIQSAFFNFIQFLANPAEIIEFQKDLKGEQTILRFILLNLPFKEGQQSGGVAVLKSRGRQPFPKKDVKKPFEPVLTNEALEKKIEEILQ